MEDDVRVGMGGEWTESSGFHLSTSVGARDPVSSGHGPKGNRTWSTTPFPRSPTLWETINPPPCTDS